MAADVWASKKDLLADSMMGEGIGGGFGDFYIHSKDTFSKDSKEVIWFAGFKGFMTAYQANLSAQWITPAGETFKTEKFTTRYGNNRFGWAKLDIKGVDHQALSLEGEWTVKIFWDDELIDTKKFYLGERKFAASPPVEAKPIAGIENAAEMAGTAEGHIRLAKVFFSKNDTERAIQELLSAQKLSPESSDPYLVLGSVFNAINKPDDAILQFSKAQSLKADPVAVHRGYGVAYVKLNMLDEAIKEYKQLLSERPDSKEDADKLRELEQAALSKVTSPNENPADLLSDIGYVDVVADSKKVVVGQPLILKYLLYVKKSATYKGFYKELEVKGQMMNMKVPDPSSDDGAPLSEKPFFLIGVNWNVAAKKLEVIQISGESPCWDALRVGDRIIAIDGEQMTSIEKYAKLLSSRSLDKETTFSINRDNKDMDVRVVPMRSVSDASVYNRSEYIGFDFTGKYATGQGVRVVASEKSSALKAGDVIKQVDDLTLNSANDWRKFVNTAKENSEFKFKIVRDKKEQMIPILAKKQKPGVEAEYMPKTPVLINRKETRLGSEKYIQAAVETIKIKFSSPGFYTIDPGSVLVYSEDSPNPNQILGTQTIEVAVMQ